MKKSQHYLNKIPLLLIGIALLFTGCIEIIEDITIHKDKSGTLIYRIETSKGGSFFKSLTSLFDVSIEDQVRNEAEKFIKELQVQPGISNIQYNLHGGSGSYFLQFDFSDYKSFNHSLYAISGNKKTIFTPGYIKTGRSRFKKINFTPWLKRYIEKENIQFPNALITDMVTYKAVIHVPNDIVHTNPAETIIDQSMRSTVQYFKFTDVLEGKVNTRIKIRY